MTVGEFWAGKIASMAQARAIIVQASGALFAFGVIAVVAGMVLTPVLLIAGALFVAMAFAVRLSRNEIVIAFVLAVFAVSMGETLFTLARSLGTGAFGWPPLVRGLLEAVLIYALVRAFLAARFLRRNPATPEPKVFD
jgi:hypothetical protein